MKASNLNIIAKTEMLCSFFWKEVKKRIHLNMTLAQKEAEKKEILVQLETMCISNNVNYNHILKVLDMKNFYRGFHEMHRNSNRPKKTKV